MAVSAFTVPFSEQSAREMVDRQYWDSPLFQAKNRSISLVWSGVILIMAICHLIAGALAASSILPGRHPGSFFGSSFDSPSEVPSVALGTAT